MQWLTNLFKPKPREPELVHPIFGIMASYKSHDGSTYWQTYEEFETVIGPLNMTIDGSAEGPSEELVASWHAILADINGWKAKAEPKLRETMQGFGHDKKFNELRLVGFGMYTVGREPIDWDMDFELESEGFNYSVCFKDGEPTLVHADS